MDVIFGSGLAWKNAGGSGLGRPMNTAFVIVRLLLVLIVVVFGLHAFLHFIPMLAPVQDVGRLKSTA